MTQRPPDARSLKPEAEAGPLRFGPFELDPRSRELRKAGSRIRLQDQPFEILRTMLERPGEVITRDELRQRLWPQGTFVDFEHSLNAAVKRLRAALGDDADNPRFVETVPRRGYRFIGAVGAQPAEGTQAGLRRVAVLPFTNRSADAGQEYFADGLTEEMITQLGQRCRGRLGVVARWSSMVFKGSSERLRDIARTLRADYLLEGSVRREGDRVRVTAGLVEAASETRLWAETFEHDLTDCLSVQVDVAARIAESLALELAPAEPPNLSGVAASASAYQEYLKGRYHWNQWLKPDDPSGDEALVCFARALQLDPKFGPAHASLARVHVAQAVYYRARPRGALEAARTAAKRALDLEPRLSEGHLALADVHRMLEWDWRGAEASYLQAVSLNPSEESAHRRYGTMLCGLRRHEEAIREADRACELDPLCLVVTTTAARIRYLAGDYDGALEQCRRATDLDPQYVRAREVAGTVYLQMGRTRDAVAVLAAAAAEPTLDPPVVASFAHAAAVAGDRRTAEDALSTLRRIDGRRYVSRYCLALALVAVGDVEGAFHALEQAVADADPALLFLGVEPRFAPLRGDSRYARLIDLLGLEG